MVKLSYHQKPYRRIIMEKFGATVYSSPSERTQCGQSVLAQDSNSPGSLVIATPAIAGASVSEAVEAAASRSGAGVGLVV
jgi:tryptophan synthase beta chain